MIKYNVTDINDWENQELIYKGISEFEVRDLANRLFQDDETVDFLDVEWFKVVSACLGCDYLVEEAE